jgi:hypothetical protein
MNENVAHEPPRQVGHFSVLPTLLCHTACVSVTEQCSAKPYLYNKNKKTRIKQVNNLLLSAQTFGSLKRSKFYKYHACMLHTNKRVPLATLIVT